MKHPLKDLANLLHRPVESAAQSDLQAKALQSGHPDAGGMYHATVRLSLELDRHFLGPTIQADCGDLLNGLSVEPAGMSGSKFFEQSLSTHSGYSKRRY